MRTLCNINEYQDLKLANYFFSRFLLLRTSTGASIKGGRGAIAPPYFSRIEGAAALLLAPPFLGSY